jgi:peptide/nickel transport system permease protein
MTGGPARKMLRTFGRTPTGPLSLAGLLVIVTVAVVAPITLGNRAARLDVPDAAQGISSAHWLGTDSLGRDILARTLVATRLSLELAVFAVALAAVVGGASGCLVAISGSKARRAGSAVIDATLTFPDILLAIVVVAFLGVGARSAALAVGVAFAPGFARLANTLAASVAGREYIAGARVIGVTKWRLLTRYVLPNIADGLAVAASSTLGQGVIAISSLSFLGLGVQPPQFDWGSMLTQGVEAIYITPAAALAPAFMIGFTGLVFALLGDAIGRSLNPVVWNQQAFSLNWRWGRKRPRLGEQP